MYPVHVCTYVSLVNGDARFPDEKIVKNVLIFSTTSEYSEPGVCAFRYDVIT